MVEKTEDLSLLNIQRESQMRKSNQKINEKITSLKNQVIKIKEDINSSKVLQFSSNNDNQEKKSRRKRKERGSSGQHHRKKSRKGQNKENVL